MHAAQREMQWALMTGASYQLSTPSCSVLYDTMLPTLRKVSFPSNDIENIFTDMAPDTCFSFGLSSGQVENQY